MNNFKLLTIQVFILILLKINFLYAEAPLPFNNIVLHKNPLQVSQVKFKDFNLKDIQINKNDGNIKILNFWATWCIPCKKEMLSLDNLQKKNRNILVFPINVDKPDKEKTKNFFKDLNIKYLQIYFDHELKLVNQFKLRGVPTTILLNEKGEEFARVVGEANFNSKNFIKWLNNFK